MTLRSIGVDGIGSGASDGHTGLIAFSNCQNLALDSVSISGSPGNGIYLEDCSGTFANCWIDKVAPPAFSPSTATTWCCGRTA